MNLQHISIQNFCGMRHLDVELTAPITLFAGKNHAGKTSILEAVRLALTGNFNRVALKKELRELVTSGAKKGSVSVKADAKEYKMTLPKGSGTPACMSGDALNFVLGDNFSKLSTDDKRKLLFGLCGVDLGREAITERLNELGLNADKVGTISFGSPFDVANGYDFAKSAAKDARAAWKATTGETYGSNKAESWVAAKPDVTDIDKDHCAAEIAVLQKELQNIAEQTGEIKADKKANAEKTKQITLLTSKAQSIESTKSQVSIYEKQLAELNKKLSVAESYKPAQDTIECPCCNASLVLKSGKLVKADDAVVKKDEQAEISKIPEYKASIEKTSNFISDLQANLAVARDAKIQLESLGGITTSENSVDEELKRLSDLCNHKNDLVAFFQKQLQKAESIDQQIEHAEQRTMKAAQYHADVCEWEAIADALSPDGVPAEILGKALLPVNLILQGVAKATTWAQVQIHSDMSITASGRAYNLLSLSEKWRTDTAIAYAISQLSGVGIMLLDGFDVLDIPSRLQLMKWLHGLATESKINNVIMCGTLKELPTTPPQFACYWIADGSIGQSEIAA